MRTAVYRASTVRNTSASMPICGGRWKANSNSASAPAASRPTVINARCRCFAVSFVRSIVATDRLPAVPRGQRNPGVGLDERGDEAYRAVAEEHVAAVAVLAPHLVGVAERVVGGVDDDLRVV